MVVAIFAIAIFQSPYKVDNYTYRTEKNCTLFNPYLSGFDKSCKENLYYLIPTHEGLTVID